MCVADLFDSPDEGVSVAKVLVVRRHLVMQQAPALPTSHRKSS